VVRALPKEGQSHFFLKTKQPESNEVNNNTAIILREALNKVIKTEFVAIGFMMRQR